MGQDYQVDGYDNSNMLYGGLRLPQIARAPESASARDVKDACTLWAWQEHTNTRRRRWRRPQRREHFSTLALSLGALIPLGISTGATPASHEAREAAHTLTACTQELF